MIETLIGAPTLAGVLYTAFKQWELGQRFNMIESKLYNHEGRLSRVEGVRNGGTLNV